jgi:hypothetical protein
MQHLNEEQLVLHRYRDDAEDAGAIGEHLMACVECRAQYDTLCRVLALVDELPVPQRGDEYGTEVWNRLRWRLGRRERRRMWQAFATAATIALVFFAGGLWYARRNAGPGTAQPQIAQGGSPVASTASTTAASSTLASSTTSGGSGNRILLVVVSDHLDNSERMLLELTNADSRRGLDVTANRRRAEELVEANRLYRQTATQKGDSRIAALLSDLEPVLVELSHSSDRLSPAELASLQKRIDSKGLLFKVRVVSAQVSGRQAPTLPKGTNSL